jgi:hypothetical protein
MFSKILGETTPRKNRFSDLLGDTTPRKSRSSSNLSMVAIEEEAANFEEFNKQRAITPTHGEFSNELGGKDGAPITQKRMLPGAAPPQINQTSQRICRNS